MDVGQLSRVWSSARSISCNPLPALRAEAGPPRVRRSAATASAAEHRFAPMPQVRHVYQFVLDPLKSGGTLDQQLYVDVVADRHLVEETAELRLHQRKALGQSITLGVELRLCGGWLILSLVALLVRAPQRPHGTEIEFGRPCWELT
jgi:hypothetical protein